MFNEFFTFNYLKKNISRPLFNNQTFIGFYINSFVHFITCIAYHVFYSILPILQIGFCMYMRACVADFKSIMEDVAKHIEKHCGEKEFRTSDLYIRNSFKEAVALHVDMLRWVIFVTKPKKQTF